MAQPTFRYTLPATVREKHYGDDSKSPMPTTVTMRALTAEDELQAHKVGGFNGMKAQYEATKRSIVQLDDKPVSAADGSVDVFWKYASPNVRSLLLQAYNRISGPTLEEEVDFFRSQEMKVS